MKFFFFVAMFCAVFYAVPALAQSSPAPASTAAPAIAPATIPDAMTARAKAMYLALIAKNVDRKLLSATMNKAMTDELLTSIASQLAPLGAPVSFAPYSQQLVHADHAYVFLMTFKDGSKLYWIFAIDPQDMVDGLWAKPVS